MAIPVNKEMEIKDIIKRKPDVLYRVILKNGEKLEGKVHLIDDGIIMRKRKFSSLSNYDVEELYIAFENINAIEAISKQEKEVRIFKKVLIGMAVVTGVMVFLYFTTIGNT